MWLVIEIKDRVGKLVARVGANADYPVEELFGMIQQQYLKRDTRRNFAWQLENEFPGIFRRENADRVCYVVEKE